MAIITLANNPSHAVMLDMRANIPFANPDGEELALQLIKPRWASGGPGFPLVLFIQGSGWTKPDQFWQLPALSQLAARGFSSPRQVFLLTITGDDTIDYLPKEETP